MDVKSSLLLLLLLPLLLLFPSGHCQVLTVGFYRTSCPSAETVVRSAVAAAVAANPGIAAGLIRMHFHDCFVRGCDASVLLRNGTTAERDSPPNLTLRGFEVIDSAKAQLEAACPNTVSCADILTFAARDSAALVGNISYDVPSGRRDGLVSIDTEALNELPPPTDNVSALIGRFATKNLTELDMVTLSGAHSIGVAGCASFSNRLFNANGSRQVDPTLDPTYAAVLLTRCPTNTSTGTVNMDSITPNVLDNNYYVGLTRNPGLFSSDQTLLTRNTSNAMVTANVNNASAWATLFAQSMVKMGAIQVLTGTQGQIRRNCSVLNPTAIDLLLPKSTETSQVASS